MSSKLIPVLGRLGFATRAILYMWLGLLVCHEAVTRQGRPDFTGTFSSIDAIGGPVLLLVTSVGLWGYAVWRWTEAVRNPEKRAMWPRQAIALRGALHAWLGITAIRLALLHWTEPRPVRQWVATVSAYPLGRVLVVAAGGGALWFAWSEAKLARRGVTPHYVEHGNTAPVMTRAVQCVGRVGMVGRAATLSFVAVALLAAGLHRGAPRAVDVADIFIGLSAGITGRAVVFCTGVALACYGAYLGILAWRRRMPA